jgi:WD40 repeat protein
MNSNSLIAAAGSTEGKGLVTVWSFGEGDITETAALTAHNSSCLNLKIDANFERMAVGSTDYGISLWNLDDLICYASAVSEYAFGLAEYDISLANELFLRTSVRCLSFSGDGRMLSVCGENNIISVVKTPMHLVLFLCLFRAFSWTHRLEI